MTAREAHPVADLFPMLADDELAELAEDIKVRGLLQPIVLDGDGRVLDGRNRLAACELADVAPEFTTYDGDDPDGYALAVNIARRHLTKGQIAMVAARADRVLSQNTMREAAKDHEVSASRIAYAKTVLDHAPDLADLVVSGAQSLDAAYDIARQRKKDRDSDEKKMARLHADAPDLAAQVTEENLTLGEAIAALDARQRKAAENRRDARALLTRIVDLTAPESMTDGFTDSWATQLGDTDDELADLLKRAEQAATVLLDLIERTRQ